MDTEKIINALKRNFGKSGYENFSAFDFLHAEGSAKNAILYGSLFFPEFVEIDGTVLLKTNVADQENLDRFYSLRSSGTKHHVEIEDSFNFLEVIYCFGGERNELSFEDEELLAEMVAESWRCRLVASFPGRSFEVKVCHPGEISDVFSVRFREQKK